jgi:N4-gp56 family major capsid protein
LRIKKIGGMKMARSLIELTQTGDMDAWIPVDVYAQTVLAALIEKEKLAPYVGMRVIKTDRMGGDNVQIKKRTTRTAEGPITEGNTLTETDQPAVSTVTVTLGKYGDADLLTAESMEDVPDDTKALVLTSMGEGIASKLDELRYAALIDTGMSAHEEVEATSQAPDWDDIVDLGAKLQGNNVDPDTAIMHPTVFAVLLKNDPFKSAAVYGTLNALTTGKIGVIGGYDIVITNRANTLAATLDLVLIVIIDSRLALAEVYGRPLTFSESYVQLTDQYRLVCWIRYGVDTMTEEAIGWIVNPAV